MHWVWALFFLTKISPHAIPPEEHDAEFCGIAVVPHPYLQLLTPQYHRHPVMNALHECVGLRGENHIFTLPGKLIPDSRQVQGLLLSWKIETVLPLLPCLVRSPLIKTCGGYYAHLSSGGHPLYRRPAAFLFVEVLCADRKFST